MVSPFPGRRTVEAVNRTDRLYAIAEALRAAGPKGLTSDQLAARFEVATRTVKRDVLALQEAGAPVTGIGGPGGGYVLDAAATLPPVTFTVAEAIAMAVAVSTSADQPFAADARRALTKLLDAVPPSTRASAETLAGKVWVRSGVGADGDGDRDTDEPVARSQGARPRSTGRRPTDRVVEEAVRTGTVVVIDYVDAAGKTTIARPVEALGLAHRDGIWYLLAWCRRRDAERWFRFDRILVAHATGTSVEDRDVSTIFGVPPADAGPITFS
ncbi:MAG: Helix-turn-helix type 11 domain protein [Acidimicrobiales bacterium]|nr:Helix-turn-helix type 11 domain protein [Acidimicrobiales bacterium]